MEITKKVLPKSRLRLEVTLKTVEVDQQFEHAAVHLAESEKMPGFRPGKVPAKLVREQIEPEKLREEAYSLAVRDAWREITQQLSQEDKDQQVMPIEDPAVEVEEFAEGKEAKLSFEFDIRPKVTVAGHESIKVKKEKEPEVTEADVKEVVDSLRRNAANFIIKLEPAQLDDKIEVSFEGYVGGVKKDKLSAQKFPFVLGQGSVIPGFGEELIGLKKNDKKEFELKFPKDHFDKELADQKVKFYVTVDDVFTVILPELNEEFAKKFGKDSVSDLDKSISDDLLDRKITEQFISQKAKWLSDFEKKIKVEVPVSLINAEVQRSEQAWREFLAERQLNPEEWLKTRATTLEKMREDWTKAAEATVTVGLGIAELAKQQNKQLQTNEDFQTFVDGLVRSALN